MREFVVPLSAPEATDADRFGPKAANQAALGQAGLWVRACASSIAPADAA